MRYLLGVFATVFVLIAAIFWIANSGDSRTDAPVESKTVLTDYADSSAKLVYEIRGELVGDNERQAVRITVDRNLRTIELLDGYQQKVVEKRTFPNNSAAFEEFTYGLSRAGFVESQNSDFDSEKGVCPNGNITIYKLADGSDEISRLWGSSCSKDKGTFDGNRRIVKDLFEDQIPGYRELLRDNDVKL